MRIGALGGPTTFAGQAAERFRDRGELSYFATAQKEWQALQQGAIDAFVMLAESSTTGAADLARRAASPDFPYFVLAEAQVPYGCLLLAKAESGPVRRILGHGSVSQCRAYLDAHYPGIEIEVEQTSSLAAAETVLHGDGSLALVGTASTAEQFGFEVLARDIDAGATGNYCLIGREAAFADQPRTVIVSGRFDGGVELGYAIALLGDAGFSLRTISTWATGSALFAYDYLLAFQGQGGREAVQPIIASAPALRLVGAF